MNLLIVLAIIAISFKEATNAYASFPFRINNIDLDVGNSTLPRTTSHPNSYRPLLRFSLPPSESYQLDKEHHEYKEEDTDWEDFHKRVPRDHTRSSNAPRLGDDNHLQFTDADDGNSQSHQTGSYTEAKQPGPSRMYNRTEHAHLLRLAGDHQRIMATEGVCRVPKPEVVYFSRNTNTIYSPRATILHRCRDTYGCCAAGFTCQAKSNETVERVFIIKIGFISWPEIKKMENHTECECVKVEMRRKRSPICQCPKHFINFSLPGTYPEARAEEEDQVTDPWERKERKEQRCRCDCHLSDNTCKSLKNGVEGFSVMERRRIQSGEISPPFCNYGPYDVKKGRCPGFQNPNINMQQKFQSRRQHGKS